MPERHAATGSSPARIRQYALEPPAGHSAHLDHTGGSGEGIGVVSESKPGPAAKPKLPPEERRRRWEERLAALRLRMAIGRELDEREITDPAAVGAALGMPAAEATKLLTRHQWREGDVALLTAAAARMGLPTGGA